MTVTWWVPSDITVYRFLKHSAYWSPTDPYKDAGGRFDDASRFTLYLAESAEGATAEFFRRNPTLLELQDESRIRVFEIALSIVGPCADVRTEPLAVGASIAFDRLVSNEPNPDIRYLECRNLATAVERDRGCGIAYPSAALVNLNGWNLVVFGQAGPDWRVLSATEIPRPSVDPACVRQLPPQP